MTLQEENAELRRQLTVGRCLLANVMRLAVKGANREREIVRMAWDWIATSRPFCVPEQESLYDEDEE